MRDAECLCQFVGGNHGRVTPTALEAAEILLTEAGTRFDLFLRQVFLPRQAGKVLADQFAHIHAMAEGDRGSTMARYGKVQINAERTRKWNYSGLTF